MASAVLILVGAALALTAQQLLSDDAVAEDAGSATVRISALKSEDGAVRVALQEQGGDGAWQPRQHPRLNTVEASARTGVWLNSSPLHVSAVEAAVAMADEPQPLFCVIHHGTPGDPFWRSFDATLNRYAGRLGIAGHMEIHAKPIAEDQAAAIHDCTAREAGFIATTIPSAEALRGAAHAAVGSGAIFISFNSGADLASSLRSWSHVGLDDTAAGEIAGKQFNEAGVNGAVLCVVHEPDNVGLANRCDGLASTYTGDVKRLDLSPASSTDSAAATEQIASAAKELSAGAVLVLNNALVRSAVSAADGAVVGAVAAVDTASVRALVQEDVLFVVDPALQSQVHYLVGTMMTVPGRGESILTSGNRGDSDAISEVAGTPIHLIRPRVFTAALLRTLFEENPNLRERLGLTDGSGN